MDNYILTWQIALCSGLLGAILTAIVNLGITYHKENNETKSIIKSLLTELNMLKNILKEEFGEKLSEDKEALYYSYPVDTDYFCVYHSNADKIGRIKNDELRQTIIALYTLAKFFIDCLKTNNNCLKDWGNICNILKQNPNNPILLEDYNNACFKLKSSKNKNLIPTYSKLLSLFDKLDKCK